MFADSPRWSKQCFSVFSAVFSAGGKVWAPECFKRRDDRKVVDAGTATEGEQAYVPATKSIMILDAEARYANAFA
jgi:hypothetical protein